MENNILDTIKEYLIVDEDFDVMLIETLIKSAETYLENAGVKVSYEVELYSLAIKMLVLHWYENRSVIGSDEKICFGLDNMIMQLIYCYEVQI